MNRAHSINYDRTSIESIYEFAKSLTGKSLDEAVQLPPNIVNKRNRGDLGSLVEEYFFQHKPPNNRLPDFPDAGPSGLELKTTGVKKASDGSFRVKERLVLTMIDYKGIVNENWISSELVSKCRCLLILFYLYSKDIPVHRRKFVLNPLLLEFLKQDEEIIRHDWEVIRQKVVAGKAHELSEGDTLYLGACRKGAGGVKEKLRIQPNSSTKAKARAFSFKPEYLNSLLDKHVKGGKSQSVVEKGALFENSILQKFDPFIGKTISEIAKRFGFAQVNPRHKSFESELARRILSGGNSRVPELEKAGIIVKTVRLVEGRLKESVSFPTFRYLDIVSQDWEESEFFERIERKFLFVVVNISRDGAATLNRVGFWNMPYTDRLEAERVWQETKRRVAVDCTKLPKESESAVAHVRPHARNKKDTFPTPQGTQEVKKCFWLNRAYVENVVKTL